MDPIRESHSLPPPSPVVRAGAGRSGDPSASDRRGAREGQAGAEKPNEPTSTPVRRGTVPPRAVDDLARAAEQLATPVEGDEQRHSELRARLDALGLDPRGGAATVRELAGQAAVPLRVALLAAAAELGRLDLGAALTELSERLVRALPLGAATASSIVAAQGATHKAQPTTAQAIARAALQVALTRLGQATFEPEAAVQAGLGRDALNQLAEHLLEAFGRALGEQSPGAVRDGLLAALARANGTTLAQRLGGPTLAALLALPSDAPLRLALLTRAFAAVHPRARDPRLALLADLANDHVAPAERALAALVGALENEAAQNAARREGGDPTVWSLPIFVGGQWSTITLSEDRHGQDTRDRARGDGGTRIAIGTDFSALGPVRADLAVSDERVVLRFVVSEPETARVMRVALADLRTRLESGEREVLIAVAEGRAEDARVEQPPPLMDHLDLRG